MKLITVMLTIFTCKLVVSEYKSDKFDQFEHITRPNIDMSTFVTKVDHARPQDSRTAIMQYHANLNTYLPGRSIYIYIKNVSDNSTRWIEEGLMVDIARNNLGALFTFDQRFFGSNLMFDEFSWDNLRYLTIEQMLADIATFIQHIRQTLNTPTAPVILWGSQFGATLAAWTRLKYPHLVNGVWSSSGIYEINYMTTAYYDLIAYTLSQSSTACRYQVAYAFEEIENMIANEKGDEIRSTLHLCEYLETTSTSEIAMVLENLINMITQYIDRFHFHGVQNFCHDISSTSSTPLEAIIRWARFVYGTENECFDFGYSSAVQRYSNTTLPRLAWHYLQCTQAGSFKVTDSYNWLTNRIYFGYHLTLCRDVLGDQYDAISFMNSIAELELQFAGYYQPVTNIIYTNGFIDPWLYDGIVSTRAENATVINIDYYSTSADLTSLNGWDSYDLTLAKRNIRNIINEWSYV